MPDILALAVAAYEKAEQDYNDAVEAEKRVLESHDKAWVEDFEFMNLWELSEEKQQEHKEAWAAYSKLYQSRLNAAVVHSDAESAVVKAWEDLGEKHDNISISISNKNSRLFRHIEIWKGMLDKHSENNEVNEGRKD